MYELFLSSWDLSTSTLLVCELDVVSRHGYYDYYDYYMSNSSLSHTHFLCTRVLSLDDMCLSRIYIYIYLCSALYACAHSLLHIINVLQRCAVAPCIRISHKSPMNNDKYFPLKICLLIQIAWNGKCRGAKHVEYWMTA